jgi:hypothetical protein
MMKCTRLLAISFNLYSMSAIAAHVCEVKLAHMEDYTTTVATKIVETKHGMIKSEIFGTMLVEDQKISRSGKEKSKTVLDLHGVVDGWDSEQESTFVFIRKTYKNGVRKDWQGFEQRFTVKGTDRLRGFFDEYKVDISCVATNENQQNN